MTCMPITSQTTIVGKIISAGVYDYASIRLCHDTDQGLRKKTYYCAKRREGEKCHGVGIYI